MPKEGFFGPQVEYSIGTDTDSEGTKNTIRFESIVDLDGKRFLRVVYKDAINAGKEHFSLLDINEVQKLDELLKTLRS